MTRSLAFVSAVIVVGALALPPAVEAQASRRGGGESGGSSGGSRGGDSGGGTAAPRHSPPPAPAPAPAPSTSSSSPRRVSDGPRRAPESVNQPVERRGGAVARSASRPIVTSGSRVSERRDPVEAANLRVRTAQASRGQAIPRSLAPIPNYPDYPSIPWHRWSPWYYGHIYSPWTYGGGAWWGWHRYGWHDPYLYDPFGYGYGYPYYWPTTVVVRDNDDRDERVGTGSLRLRVNPKHARVYVDGALAGTVEEFSGLSDHLELEAGVHELEFRADGYAPQTTEVTVKAGQTRTARANLDRQD